MNVVTTACEARPVKNRRATSWLCDLFGWPPEVAHARADALATPGEGTGPTGWMLPTCRPGPLTRRRSAAPLAPRAPRLRPLSPFKVYSCHSWHSWATHLAPSMSGATSPIPLCLQSFSPVSPRCVAPFPQGMSAYAEQFASPKPEPLPRKAGVLACQLPHRPGACLFLPRAPRPVPRAPRLNPPNLRLHPPISAFFRP